MIKVEEVEHIRRLHLIEHKSIREIARETGRSRRAIRKALADPGPPVYQLKERKAQPEDGPLRRRD